MIAPTGGMRMGAVSPLSGASGDEYGDWVAEDTHGLSGEFVDDDSHSRISEQRGTYLSLPLPLRLFADGVA
jgi:hypothetical protein